MTYHRDRCRNKTAYPTSGEARKVLRRRRFHDPQGMEGVRVYPCPFTDDGKHWHLGHTPSVEGLETLAREIRGL